MELQVALSREKSPSDDFESVCKQNAQLFSQEELMDLSRIFLSCQIKYSIFTVHSVLEQNYFQKNLKQSSSSVRKLFQQSSSIVWYLNLCDVSLPLSQSLLSLQDLITVIVFYMVVHLLKFKICNLYKMPLLDLLPIVKI